MKLRNATAKNATISQDLIDALNDAGFCGTVDLEAGTLDLHYGFAKLELRRGSENLYMTITTYTKDADEVSAAALLGFLKTTINYQ